MNPNADADCLLQETGNGGRTAPRPALVTPALILACLLSLVTCSARAQGVEQRPERIQYNHASTNGVPISNTVGSPQGSDGRAPGPIPGPIGTPFQFQSAAPLGGGIVTNSRTAAYNLALARVGGPYAAKIVTFLFGETIPVPVTDEFGSPLVGISPTNYWAAEPFTTTGHTNPDRSGYYWSPNKLAVFAVNPGPVEVVWRRAVPAGPINAVNVGTVNLNSVTYRVYTNRVVVAGAAIKPPRNLFWTEGVFLSVGKPVAVPTGRIGEIKVVYNMALPPQVDTPYTPPTPPANNQPAYTDLRTLWYDQGTHSIRAYNAEGRVFVELLGDIIDGTDRREHLGFEIVDVQQRAVADDVSVELGSLLPAYQDNSPVSPDLVPEQTLQLEQSFTFRHAVAGTARSEFYAIRETANQNDSLLFWLEPGLEGLRWPLRLVRYNQHWPTDISHYSHYIRPAVSTRVEASATAVALPAENSPSLVFQDLDPIGHPRGEMTEDRRYFTFLTPEFPTHRGLIQYLTQKGVWFEPVFSWLDSNLKSGNLASQPVLNLSAWDPINKVVDWPAGSVAPRQVTLSATVGSRIPVPVGEIGAGLNNTNYLAGHIRQTGGTFFNPHTYIDPFTAGFAAANKGAIIPVNSLSGKNQLEVWWFRANGAATAQGFGITYWPEVIATYTVGWPSSPDEIVLASNQGSPSLPSLQAKGSVYVQNDASRPGFNPNEEHALLLGNQVFGLRDDLNTANSSQPFVLLEYTESDGRGAMRAFKVLREKPAAGQVFDYAVNAGSVIDAPMPLRVMEKPLAPSVVGEPPRSLNVEMPPLTIASEQSVTAIYNSVSAGPLPVGIASQIRTSVRHSIRTGQTLALQNLASGAAAGDLHWLYVTNAEGLYDTVQGVISDQRPLTLSSAIPQPGVVGRYRYVISAGDPILPLSVGLMLWDNPRSSLFVTMVSEGVANGVRYVDVDFRSYAPTVPANAASASRLVIGSATPPAILAGMTGWTVTSEPVPVNVTLPDLKARYTPFTFMDRKGTRWVYRGPHDPRDSSGSLVMQFYYKTQPGFFFPSLAEAGASQPPVGTVTPYLRPLNQSGNGYEGDPVYGNQDGDPAHGDGNSLGITFRAAWPANVPVLQMAETLTLPKRGLPAIRGETSLELFYQQSQATGGDDKITAYLHDPTREKRYAFSADGLDAVPATIKTASARGKTFFPNLPPHLVDRFFVDPDRGSLGSLVFNGQFVDPGLGETYLLLNTLSTADVALLKNLCPGSDSEHKQRWDDAIDGLSTDMETFIEDPGQVGSYIPGDSHAVGGADLCVVDNSDIAVDSYALSAVGPGTGYITLISGNGRAFTPEGDPVSVKVIRVVEKLYRGEVDVVASSNPLSETVILQQVADLASQVQNFKFEWRIAPPTDGLPPVVYQSTGLELMGNGTWNHLRYPLSADQGAAAATLDSTRLLSDTGSHVVPISSIPFGAVTAADGGFQFDLAVAQPLSAGNALRVRWQDGQEFSGAVRSVVANAGLASKVTVDFTGLGVDALTTNGVSQLYEEVVAGQPQSILVRDFTEPANGQFSQYWMSILADPSLSFRLSIDGSPAVSVGLENPTAPSSPPAGLSPLAGPVFRIPASYFAGGSFSPEGGRTHRVSVEIYSHAAPDSLLPFNVRLETLVSVDHVADNPSWQNFSAPDGIRATLGGGADVRTLGDNYVIMRFQAADPSHASWQDDGAGGNKGWSQWTEPTLVEGWIKRVLKGVNPFNQRIADLLNNRVNTDVSLVSQAGQRWEGDVALNLDSINNSGLIEIYETVLKRGRLLSIDSGIRYGPANDALLLAAGYLNDLYMILGNEASADAANPTIGIGTKDKTYGDIATSLFAFKGQLPTLLEEELALLRGRDDFLLPGVELRPVYNRLVWNYTRGIDAGEVIYALNYNILDQNSDGVTDANDARVLYPQGHGDAYGHYLTALKGYYSLLLNPSFEWVPSSEAVTILGKPVSVDYLDERKFAAAAAAVARTGRQIFDLSWRRDFKSGTGQGWSHFAESKPNTGRTVGSVRRWGMDQWASRAGQGAFLNWVVGNTLLPAVDPDPAHQGTIQQIDRTTVPELTELSSIGGSLQTEMDSAESGLTPLGIPEGTVPFDINPNGVVGADNATHFDQIYTRAKAALNNAVAAFDDAKDVTRLMRSEQDSLADFKSQLNQQELAYENSLIEIYGTPYTDDIGPGKTYRTGYTGPDLVHSSYVDMPETSFGELWNHTETRTFYLDIQNLPADWATTIYKDFNFTLKQGDPGYTEGVHYVTYTLASLGAYTKPASWTGRRASPGKIQQAISEYMQAQARLKQALYDNYGGKGDLDKAIRSFEDRKSALQNSFLYNSASLEASAEMDQLQATYDLLSHDIETSLSVAETIRGALIDGVPDESIVGTAVGGDIIRPGVAVAADIAYVAIQTALHATDAGSFRVLQNNLKEQRELILTYTEAMAQSDLDQTLKDNVTALFQQMEAVQAALDTINVRLREQDDAERKIRGLQAQGLRTITERETYRKRAAAVVQGFRTRDAAFRFFRTEKLERYKTLFDLAAEYAFMAGQAYDYETGLLGKDQGRDFLSNIIRSRALGVVRSGEPQFAGSATGDPGLSSALAEMAADWSVVKGRLGFNNPDAYGTTASLRSEKFRILPGTNGLVEWKNVLNRGRVANLLEDADVRRYCMQMNLDSSLPLPGLVIEFSTTIADGQNLFGKPLAAYDHAFSPTAFATKIFAAGVALEGYVGMADPAANSTVVGSGAVSPADPTLSFLDPVALSATPYIYLIPVGVDSMRSPALGDTGDVRTWNIADVAVPLPFNIGGSAFSTTDLYQSSDSLSEEPFTLRKHQAFRPVSSSSLFSPSIYTTSGGGLQRSQFTNNRLIGRSVWNSKWKIVIPGRTLLADPDEGLDRFINSVTDIRLHFVTYSYSGN